MWSESYRKGLRLLLVEDDPADILLLREVLTEAKVALDLQVINGGEEALAYLRRQGRHAGAPRPDLIMLDLNLPGLSGRQVLQAIKDDPELWPIPVVVLSASQAEDDVVECYRLKANCYIVKPVILEQFIEVIRAIERFWLFTVKLPGR